MSREDQQKRLALAVDACNKINEVSVQKGVDRRIKEMAQLGSRRSVMIPKTGSHDKEITGSEGFTIQGKGVKEMAFAGFDIVKLKEEFPSQGVGRAGKPSVAISDKGRITFSTEVSKVYDGCKVAVPGRDKDNPLRIRFDGLAEAPKGKETQVLELARAKQVAGKKTSKNVAINAVFILKFLKYDFVKAGNQTFDVEKMDVEKKSVVFCLPATLPAMKAKRAMKPRKPKAAAVVAVAPNGAPAPTTIQPTVAGGEDELAIEE